MVKFRYNVGLIINSRIIFHVYFNSNQVKLPIGFLTHGIFSLQIAHIGTFQLLQPRRAFQLLQPRRRSLPKISFKGKPNFPFHIFGWGAASKLACAQTIIIYSRGLMGLNFEWKSYTCQIQARNS